MAEAKTERNREIYEARLRGETFTKIAERYGVTVPSVRSIFEKEQKKEELKKLRIYQVLLTLTDDEQIIMKTMRVLRINHLDSKEALLGVTKKELLKCNNCGEVMANLILQVADILREETNI